MIKSTFARVVLAAGIVLTAPALVQAASDGATGTSAAERAESYMDAAEQKVAAWSDSLERHWNDASRQSARVSEDAERSLKGSWHELQRDWDELQGAAADGWDAARLNFERSLETLKQKWRAATDDKS